MRRRKRRRSHKRKRPECRHRVADRRELWEKVKEAKASRGKPAGYCALHGKPLYWIGQCIGCRHFVPKRILTTRTD